MNAEDRIYSSDNKFEIPTLRLDMQPRDGLLLPFSGWGISPRIRKGVATWHFYVEDYRYDNLWKKPERVVKSGCRETVEPNFSLYNTTPIAYGLQAIYKKRWIARWLQECGIRVWVDLNVAPKFREFNTLGIPKGYNAFATRGHEGELCQLEAELEIARCVSGKDHPNMIVYGGGSEIQNYCRQEGLVYIPEYMTDRRTKGKEAGDG